MLLRSKKPFTPGSHLNLKNASPHQIHSRTNETVFEIKNPLNIVQFERIQGVRMVGSTRIELATPTVSSQRSYRLLRLINKYLQNPKTGVHTAFTPGGEQ